jgi:hypothetical protein
MNEIKIEKGIPLEEHNRHHKYPWREMEIGDSFFVEGKTSSSLYSALSYAGSRNNLKFTVRKVQGGCRAWRIA